MLWIDAGLGTGSGQGAAGLYETLAALPPADHYVQKQGRSTGRYRLTACGSSQMVYLKRYYRLPWWQRWLAPLQSFPGPREWANLRQAARLGIPVAEPVLAGADRWHDCKSMLATCALAGHTPLHQYIPAKLSGPDTPPGRALRRAIAAALAELARRLHAAGLYHRDLYLCHFFIRENGQGSPDRFQLVLIDLMRLKRSQRKRWQVKDLAQLLYSSDLPGITRSDRLRFFKCYLGQKRLDKAARRLVRQVQRKASMYRRHNARRPRPGG